jgi:hypothetical protein
MRGEGGVPIAVSIQLNITLGIGFDNDANDFLYFRLNCFQILSDGLKNTTKGSTEG